MAPLLVKALPALRQWVGARFGEARLQAELERIHADFRKHWCPEADSEVEHEIAELEDLLHELPAGPIGERAAGETNWLLFRLQSKPGGKADKLPCADNGRGPISLHLAARWRYVDVWCEARNHGTPYGVGYLPRPGSALIGIDFDNALTSDGRIKPWAARIIGPSKAWLEVSPSGRGIRAVLARGPTTPEVNLEQDGVGLFSNEKKWFTVTFNFLPGRDQICEDDGLVERVLEYIVEHAAPRQPPPPKHGGNGASPISSYPSYHWFEELSHERKLEETAAMLQFLTDPMFGEYDTYWLPLSFSIYRATDSMGFDIWDDWCQKLPNYNAAENYAKWHNGAFNDRSGTMCTPGTLIYYARLNGYQPPEDVLRAPVREAAARLGELIRRMRPLQ
jgi:Primase C terminal 2 (PriCT-2)